MSLSRADKFVLTGLGATLGSVAVFGPTLPALALPLAGFIGLFTDGVARPASNLFYPTLSRVNNCGNRVALTFDDGPDPEVTPQILDVLTEHNALATFFVIGRLLEQHRDIARRALAAGHELGNHSFAHAYLQSMHSTQAVARDVDRATALLTSLAPQVSFLYRAPVGLKSPPIARVAHQRALTMVAWSVHSRDTMDSNPERVAARVLHRIKPGDIVLLHDGHERAGRHRLSALRALPKILAGLKERNLEPVTVSQLLSHQTLETA